jgi:hypothetical protein
MPSSLMDELPGRQGSRRARPERGLFDLLNRPSKTFEQELTPDDGSWPPGYDVNEYRTIAVVSAAPAAEAPRIRRWEGC